MTRVRPDDPLPHLEDARRSISAALDALDRRTDDLRSELHARARGRHGGAAEADGDGRLAQLALARDVLRGALGAIDEAAACIED